MPASDTPAGGTGTTFKYRLRRFRRRPLFSVIVIGFIAFTQPGIWDALNSGLLSIRKLWTQPTDTCLDLGAGGQAKPYAVNAANSITFGIMIILSPLWGVIGNIIGMKLVLLIGTAGWVIYSAGLYCSNLYGTQWLLYLGAITCGISASAFWTASTAIVLGYSEPGRRVAIWLGMDKIGSVIGCTIQLAINQGESSKGAITSKTYLALVGLQCLGLPLALCVSSPAKLIRSDIKEPGGSSPARTLTGEVKALVRVLKRKEILLLLPIYITHRLGLTYQGNFLAAYFTVRTRALMALLVAIVGIATNVVMGRIFDLFRHSRSSNAKLSWTMTAVLFTATWIYCIVLQTQYTSKSAVTLDWNSSGFGPGAASHLVYRINYEMIAFWALWMLGNFNADDHTLGLSSGILHGCESLGSTFSYALGSSPKISLLTNLVVAAALFWISVPTATLAAWRVQEPPSIETNIGLVIEEVSTSNRTIGQV